MDTSDFTRRTTLGLAVGAAAAVRANAMSLTPKPAMPAERVLGIGGFFFRAKDPKALMRWYEDNLGINPIPSNYDMQPWRQEAGPTAFAPFPESTDYFGDASKHWMLNFRVRDLDRMVAQLRANGASVDVDPQFYPNGRFAKLVDPEGNPIQLWQEKNP
jgi:predicted enzyme related to lactoylglutathione lyase